MQSSARAPAPPSSRAADRDWWWVFDPRQSLRARAALFVALGTLGFTALITWLAGLTYRRILDVQLGATLETLAFQLSDKLDRTVYERYRTLLFAATLPTLRDPSASPTERRRALMSLREAHPDFSWLALTDPTGLITVATLGADENTSAAQRPWFRAARESAYAGPLREIPELARNPGAGGTDADAAARFFDLAVPVSDSDGRFGGVLASHVRWTWTRDLRLSVIPESLARDQIGATVYAENDVLLDSGASGWTQPPDAPNPPSDRRGRGFFIERTSLGTTYLTGFARSRGFREYRGLGWLTVVRQPLDRAFAPVTSLRRTIAAWGVTLSTAAIIAAWVLAGRHARRLRIIRAAAERIHEGDILTVLPRPPGPSELSQMCASLGDLVEDLRAKAPKP